MVWGVGGVVAVVVMMMMIMIMTRAMQIVPAEVASLKLPATTEEQLTTTEFTMLTLYLQ